MIRLIPDVDDPVPVGGDWVHEEVLVEGCPVQKNGNLIEMLQNQVKNLFAMANMRGHALNWGSRYQSQITVDMCKFVCTLVFCIV